TRQCRNTSEVAPQTPTSPPERQHRPTSKIPENKPSNHEVGRSTSMKQNHRRKSPVQTLPKLAVAAFDWVACIGLLVAAASGQDRILPELRQASTSVTQLAASATAEGTPEFRNHG